MTNDELAALAEWPSSGRFDAKDRAVLRFTDALSESNRVDDDVYSELANHFSDQEIMKLSFAVGLAGMVNRVHATFKTAVDDMTIERSSDTPFCALPST